MRTFKLASGLMAITNQRFEFDTHTILYRDILQTFAGATVE